ncbi:MAG: TonB-dependent receptor [Algoriphagus sp.]|nr:TonB-dependent receptor [Algoriphagus sp.]
MKFWIYLLFLLVGTGPFSLAQELRVLDYESQKPISEVQLVDKKSKISTSTTVEGTARLSVFQGKNPLTLSLLGYKSKTLSWEEIEASNYLIYLETSSLTLATTVISASRWNQNEADVSGKVRQLDSEWQDLRNPMTSADWLGSSGEVFVQKSQLGGGSPMIRGFSANRLLYSIDGIRMNTAIFRSGNLQQVISIDPFSLQNTEILFGPGAVMYGSDAIGGVMVFETLRADHENQQLKGNMVSRISSAYSEETFHADFSYGKGKWAFVTSATYFDFGDLIMGKNKGHASYLRSTFVERINGIDQEITNPNPRKQVGAGYKQVNLMQKISFKASENSTIDYGFHYSSTGNIPRYDRLIERKDGKLRFARWDYGPQRWMMQQLNWKTTKPTKIYDQAKITAAFQFFEESRIDRRVGNATQFERVEKVQATSINADYFKALFQSQFLNYGFEAVINQVNSKGQSVNIFNQQVATTSARYPNSTWTSWAVYANYVAPLSTKLKMQSALRYNINGINADFTNNLAYYPLPVVQFKDNYHSLTGNLGFVYQVDPSFSISPQIATGFRAPNVDDMGKIFDSQPGSLLLPNPQLRPEYAYNAELNLNKELVGTLKLDLTGYYTWLDQAMVRRPTLWNGESELIYDGELSQLFSLQNGAFAKIKGIQAGFELALSRQFHLNSTYNWQKGVEELDDKSKSPSRHAAPAFGASKLRLQGKKGTLELSAQYSAAMPFEKMPQEEIGKPAIYATDANGKPYSPSWMIINLAARIPLSPYIQVNLGVENMGDLQYRGYSSGIVSPGRNFQLSVKGTF